MNDRKDKEESFPVKIQDKDTKHLFSNYVITLHNLEEMILGFGVRNIDDPNTVTIQNYFHITIPHLERLSKLLSNKVSDLNKMREKGGDDVKS